MFYSMHIGYFTGKQNFDILREVSRPWKKPGLKKPELHVPAHVYFIE